MTAVTTARRTDPTAPVVQPPKRTYRRVQQPPAARLTLNEFQADVVLNSLRNEIKRIRDDRSTPESLRMLAIRQLNSVIAQIDVPIGEPEPKED